MENWSRECGWPSPDISQSDLCSANLRAASVSGGRELSFGGQMELWDSPKASLSLDRHDLRVSDGAAVFWRTIGEHRQ